MLYCYDCGRYKEKGENFEKVEVEAGESYYSNRLFDTKRRVYYKTAFLCPSCYEERSNRRSRNEGLGWGCLSIILLFIILFYFFN